MFGKSCQLPIELEHKAYGAIKTLSFDFKATGEWRFLQLNELDELRLKACESQGFCKERTKRWHEKQIMKKRFEKGDMVLLFNSRLRLFPGKLRSHGRDRFKSPKFNQVEWLKYGVSLLVCSQSMDSG